LVKQKSNYVLIKLKKLTKPWLNYKEIKLWLNLKIGKLGLTKEWLNFPYIKKIGEPNLNG
jgi:hypothetical protein